MNDELTPNPKQQHEFIVTALEILRFEEVGDMGVYRKGEKEKQTVVDLTAGESVYFNVNGNKVDEDDDEKTLEHLKQVINDAKTGILPTQSKPDIEIVGTTDTPPTDAVDENTTPPPDRQTIPQPISEVPVSNMPIVSKPVQELTPFTPAGTMIKGLQPQLKEIGKIKIGRKGQTKQGAKGEYRLPEKLNHFEVVSLRKNYNGDFIPDDTIMAQIGPDAKEIDVMLLYNDPTLNFYTQYNEYKGGKRMCSGDGEQATKEDGTKIVCDPETCPKLKAKKCKPNGILSVVLPGAPRLGGVYKFRTTSFNSIRSILSSMFFLQSLTGGVLANIPLKLTVSSQSVNPIGSTTAQTIYVVNLEYAGTVEDLHKQTVTLMTERASMQHKIAGLEAQAQAALAIPESKEQIQEVEAEFYPDPEVST